MAVSEDLVFQPVVLRVNPAGEDQNAIRQFDVAAVLPLAVIFPAGEQAVLVLQVSPVLPQHSETGVVDYLHLPGAANGLQIFRLFAISCG